VVVTHIFTWLSTAAQHEPTVTCFANASMQQCVVMTVTQVLIMLCLLLLSHIHCFIWKQIHVGARMHALWDLEETLKQEKGVSMPKKVLECCSHALSQKALRILQIGD